jgi:hypothetical protein
MSWGVHLHRHRVTGRQGPEQIISAIGQTVRLLGHDVSNSLGKSPSCSRPFGY